MRKEQGFTLIEMMVSLSLVGILVTFSASAGRSYWFNNSLKGAEDQVVSQLRQLQARVFSESHPKVFGARFREGSSEWTLVEYDPEALAGTDSCTESSPRVLEGVTVGSASFAAASGITEACATDLGATAADHFVFFFARGTATAGEVTLVHPQLEGKSLSVTVTPITGRVEGVEL